MQERFAKAIARIEGFALIEEGAQFGHILFANGSDNIDIVRIGRFLVGLGEFVIVRQGSL